MLKPEIRYYIVRLTTKLVIETEESGKATVLVTRHGPRTEEESATVEEEVSKHYQATQPGRIVVSVTAIGITQDAYNVQRLMLASQRKA